VIRLRIQIDIPTAAESQVLEAFGLKDQAELKQYLQGLIRGTVRDVAVQKARQTADAAVAAKVATDLGF
jgi:hypothetical protein